MGITEAVKMELIPLRQKTDQLIAGVDEILINLQTVFEDSATQGLPQAFESIQRTMQNLENTSATLDLTVSENRSALKGIVDNMEELTGFVNTQQGALSNALGNFSQISDSLADLQLSTTLRKADASITELNRLLEGLNNGEGSLGKLLQDDTLHNGLLATNKEVQNLINDLYLNPQRYVRVSVFGRKENRRMSEKELERLQRLIQNELEGRAEDED
jgi:phospholipid/cholesterol/gamma-HCH transport system substrate-binding protein